MQFCNAVTRDALIMTKAREEKYHKAELLEAEKINRTSMRQTLNATKFSQLITHKTKGQIETKAMNIAKESSRKLFSKPLVSDMLVSRSTSVKKSTKNRSTRDRLFGGIP